MRRSHTLTILFGHALALAATTQLVTGCGEECSTYDSSNDVVVPPRYLSHATPPTRDAGKDARVRADADAADAADAAPDAADAADSADADADTESDADASDAGVKPAFDAATIAEWVQRPCQESCRMVHPSFEITACDAPKKNGEGEYVLHCELSSTSCKDPFSLSMGHGRRPLGFTPHDRNGTPVAAFFALMVELEDASVPAFEALGADLARHGAPASLVRRAAQAARDEVRHTKMAIALARLHGGVVHRADVPELLPRSLEEMATENAVEGCVNETYGALLASWAAARALDPRTRAAMSIVARDETHHAALAWDIAAWAESRLDVEARARVVAARREAARTLLEEATREVPKELSDAGLMPRPEQARVLLGTVERELWS